MPRGRRRMADVATESYNGDFHENRSRAWPVLSDRFVAESIDAGAARTARIVTGKVT